MRVKGKTEPISLYTAMYKQDAPSQDLIDPYIEAFKLYMQGGFCPSLAYF